MTFETAKTAVDFLMAHSVDTETVSVGFYGGEPLLRLDLIKDVLSYIKKEYLEKDVIYSVTTNATLITDEVLALFSENNFSLLISLDGPEKVHDTNRKYAADGTGSFKDVVASIRKIIYWNDTHEQKVDFSINMVMDQRLPFEDWKKLYEEVPEIEGVSSKATLIATTHLSKEYIVSGNFVNGYYYSQFLALLNHFDLIKNLCITPFIKNIVSTDIALTERIAKRKMSSLPDTTSPGGPCVPGKLRLFSNTDGVFFPCERVSETAEAMKIGTAATGFSIEKCRTLLNVGQLTDKECKNCWAFSRCSMCAQKAEGVGELSREARLTFCDETRDAAHTLLRLELLMEDIKEFTKKKKQKIQETITR